jgi:hypothetical protein
MVSCEDCINRQHQDEDEHLVKMAGGEWGLWKWVGLRGSGFALAGILNLSSPESAAAADELLLAEEHADRIWKESIGAINEQLDRRLPDQRAGLSKALRLLKNGKVPAGLEIECFAKSLIQELAAACAKVDEAWLQYDELYGIATGHLSGRIREIAQERRFQEAVIWQNRQAFQTGIAEILKSSPAESRDSKRRQHEELVASYWQRYCTKNDTIGFFGPVGWAKLIPACDVIAVRPGPDLLASRKVYFEVWGIDALAEALFKDEGVRRWIAPRRVPALHVDETTAYLPLKSPITLSGRQAAVLEACDGTRAPREIAATLASNHPHGFDREQDVQETLNELHAKGLITWTPPIPSGTRPEEVLSQSIKLVTDSGASSHLSEALHQLEEARQEVAGAPGDPTRLDRALQNLEGTFTRLTGVAATRREGRTYAGRTLVYEDCRRDIEIDIGPQILDDLGPPLSLIVASTRWFTFKVAESYRQAFYQIYNELISQTGSVVVDANAFWIRAQSALYGGGDPGTISHDALTRRWAEILGILPDQKTMSYTTEQLRPRVLAEFYAPHPGWQYARYQSPDLMIAANSVEAIKRGDYLLILGEHHIASNTLSWAFFVEQHPSPSDFFRALAADLREPRLIPMPPKYFPGKTSRCQNVLISARDVCLELVVGSPGFANSPTVAIGSLVITDDKGDLVIRTRDGSMQFNLLDTFAEALMSQIVNSFKVVAPGGHTPRVKIDRLVISRETWQFEAGELEFAFEKQEAQRFVGARRWARANDLPRYVYYKTPVEVKPYYLDFDSPIYVNILAKAIRRTADKRQDAQISVSEMLPGPDELWLTDAEGNLYTSELRMVAVDLMGKPQTKRSI